MIEKIIKRLENQNILILGFGLEGKSTLQFLRKHHVPCQIAIADKNTPEKHLAQQLHEQGIDCYFGDNYLNLNDSFDLIIKSPGIPSRLIPNHLSNKVSSQTDLFLEEFGKQTIGVTGTKGKSTTSSLIHHILVSTGRHAILTGNIGIPCFDIISNITTDTIVVFELSAHQLEFVHHSPKIGLLLNIFPEHLDHFGDFESYAAAKCNIFSHMHHGDYLIIHSSLVNRIPDAWYAQRNIYDTTEINLPTLKLRGAHFNLLAIAAIYAAEAAGVDQNSAIETLIHFEPLAHRLEPIGPIDGVLFVNDSIATIPQATIAALEAWHPNFLILGGFDRGISYSLIVEDIQHRDIPYLLLTGPAGHRMGKLIETALPSKTPFYFNTLEEAFGFIAAHANEGDVVLLSPAAASYDQYLNFEHRGNLFKELARQFKRKNPGNVATGVDY
jgi:UDP-N-acetylmuramoylalanine--D-glutamate ligase